MMIQDIGNHVFHNEFEKLEVSDKDTVFVFYGNQLLCDIDDEKNIILPTFEKLCNSTSLKASAKLREKITFLFRVDEMPYFLLRDWSGQGLDNFTYKSVEVLRNVKPKEIAFAGFSAYHLSCWYRDTKICGRCGHELVQSEKERMMYCSECKNMIYPRINPVVIVGVTKGDKILLTKYNGRTYKDYALIAGFVEFGETIEQAVEREVMEEVGLKVKNIRFYKSQPWGFSSSLLMGFYADVDGGTDISLEEEELSYGGWFRRNEINLPPDNVSLTREMVLTFVDGKEAK